jgi:hypothetical protein
MLCDLSQMGDRAYASMTASGARARSAWAAASAPTRAARAIARNAADRRYASMTAKGGCARTAADRASAPTSTRRASARNAADRGYASITARGTRARSARGRTSVPTSASSIDARIVASVARIDGAGVHDGDPGSPAHPHRHKTCIFQRFTIAVRGWLGFGVFGSSSSPGLFACAAAWAAGLCKGSKKFKSRSGECLPNSHGARNVARCMRGTPRRLLSMCGSVLALAAFGQVNPTMTPFFGTVRIHSLRGVILRRNGEEQARSCRCGRLRAAGRRANSSGVNACHQFAVHSCNLID